MLVHHHVVVHTSSSSTWTCTQGVAALSCFYPSAVRKRFDEVGLIHQQNKSASAAALRRRCFAQLAAGRCR